MRWREKTRDIVNAVRMESPDTDVPEWCGDITVTWSTGSVWILRDKSEPGIRRYDMGSRGDYIVQFEDGQVTTMNRWIFEKGFEPVEEDEET